MLFIEDWGMDGQTGARQHKVRRTHFLSAAEMLTASMASLTAWVICPARTVCWPNLVFTADWEMNSCRAKVRWTREHTGFNCWFFLRGRHLPDS